MWSDERMDGPAVSVVDPVTIARRLPFLNTAVTSCPNWTYLKSAVRRRGTREAARAPPSPRSATDDRAGFISPLKGREITAHRGTTAPTIMVARVDVRLLTAVWSGLLRTVV